MINSLFFFFFLFLFSFSKAFDPKHHVFREGNVGTITETLKQNEELSIESLDPYLCVYFVRVAGVTIDFYVDGMMYKTITSVNSIVGIDFGDSKGKVVFRPNIISNENEESVKIRFSFVVFPKICSKHRLISSVPNFELNLSKYSTENDYLITMNQQFCFWSAVPFKHEVKLNMDTENNFDILKLWTDRGVIRAFSGKVENETIMSLDGTEFFSFETDSSTLSKYVNITVETSEYKEFAIFKQMLKEFQASDVNLLFVQEKSDNKYDDNIHKKLDKNALFSKRIFPLLCVMTILLITGSVISVRWVIIVIEEDRRDREEKEDKINSYFNSSLSFTNNNQKVVSNNSIENENNNQDKSDKNNSDDFLENDNQNTFILFLKRFFGMGKATGSKSETVVDMTGMIMQRDYQRCCQKTDELPMPYIIDQECP